MNVNFIKWSFGFGLRIFIEFFLNFSKLIDFLIFIFFTILFILIEYARTHALTGERAQELDA